jgi:HlyD family secretion protein
MHLSPTRLLIAGVLAVSLSACNQDDGSVALGTLERDRVALTATVAEVLVALPVPQGSPVTKGTVLARLDATQQQAVVNQASAEVEKSRANLEKLENGARQEEIAKAEAAVAGAKAELLEAENNFERVPGPHNTRHHQPGPARQRPGHPGRGGGQPAERRSSNFLELVTGTRPEDLEMARAELAAAEASLATQQKILPT